MLGSALKSTFGFARIDQFRVQTPPDGLPSVNDWLTTIISFIFSGNKLDREPIDVCPLPRQEGEEQKYMIKKGFTRFSCLLFLAIVASELDVEAAKAGLPARSCVTVTQTLVPFMVGAAEAVDGCLGKHFLSSHHSEPEH